MTEAKAGQDRSAEKEFPLLVNGNWCAGEGARIAVNDKFLNVPFAYVRNASDQQVAEIISSARTAFSKGAPSAHARGEILDGAAQLVDERKAEFIQTMQAEAGFTQTDAAGEVNRCMQTLKLSAEEARRLSGDVVPLAGAPGQAGRFAYTLRVPLGIVVAITPFNSPLNTVAHKIAPAFAAGNAMVLKPSSSTPITAHLLVKALVDAGMPTGFLSLVFGGAKVARCLLDNPDVNFYAFTGSTEVGRIIQQSAGLRRTQMELGSIAFTILADDADLDRALPKVVAAGYRKAGQVCTSVQILLVQEQILQPVTQRLTAMVAALKFGDPRDEQTSVGPLISEKDAVRIQSWIDAAIAAGATKLVGGSRNGNVLAPTLLTNIDTSMQVGCNEIFGPVMCIVPFVDLDDAIARVNATPFGLASGIFTNRLQDAFKAAKHLQVGGVHVNETSSARVDMMPYGGSKDSGFGREGPFYAIHEMTEERIVTITTE